VKKNAGGEGKCVRNRQTKPAVKWSTSIRGGSGQLWQNFWGGAKGSERLDGLSTARGSVVDGGTIYIAKECKGRLHPCSTYKNMGGCFITRGERGKRFQTYVSQQTETRVRKRKTFSHVSIKRGHQTNLERARIRKGGGRER